MLPGLPGRHAIFLERTPAGTVHQVNPAGQAPLSHAPEYPGHPGVLLRINRTEQPLRPMLPIILVDILYLQQGHRLTPLVDEGNLLSSRQTSEHFTITPAGRSHGEGNGPRRPIRRMGRLGPFPSPWLRPAGVIVKCSLVWREERRLPSSTSGVRRWPCWR